MHCKNIAYWTRFALALLFVISSNTQAFCLPAAQASLQALQAHTKLHGASEILADFHQGAPETRVIVTLQPSLESAALETESLQAGQIPEKIRKPGAPAYYNLKNKSIRKRLRSTVSEQINRVTNTIGPKGVKVANRFRYQFGFSAIVTPEGLEKIASNPDVLAVEKDLPQYPHLAQGVPLMNALSTRTTYDGTGISIAVTDTGIDTSHPNLGGGGFPIFNSKVIGGYDTGDDDDDPTPGKFGEAHGTACAGIAGGDIDSVGDYIGGVAPGVKLYALKISTGTTGSAWSGDVVDAWEWIIDHQDDDPDNPIMVISHSFGGGRYYSTCDSDLGYYATAAANANAAGITIFASAGNDGWCDSMGAPACVSTVNAVGAVYDADIGGWGFCVDPASCGTIEEHASCSTGWIAWDAGKSPDMVTGYSNSASFLTMFAPSNSAHTTDISDKGGYNTSKSPAGDYTTEDSGFGGTSAACPYTAGAAAVLQQAAMERTGAFLTPSQLTDYLVNNGDNVTDSKPSGITKPRVNLGNAIAAIIPTIYKLSVSKDGTGTGTVTSSPGGIDCGTSCSFSFGVDTIVTLSASAGTDSLFTGWSGEGCSGTDTCEVTLDAARSVTATFTRTCYEDLDGDGYGTTTIILDNGDGACLAMDGESSLSTDCNDSNSGIHPNATEIAADNIDQNCDGQELCYKDQDNDNFRPDATSTVISADMDCTDTTEAGAGDPTGDCNDTNAAIHPGATEGVADGVDQDCNSQELCYRDLDNDTFRPDATSTVISSDLDCTDSTEAVPTDPTGDCNDTNSSIYPGATETVADGIDQDCNGQELCYMDIDNDTFRPDATSTVISADLDCTDSTEAGAGDPTGDCNDTNAAIHPGATEGVADGVDQDCNSQELCYADLDDDNYRPDATSTVISANLTCTDSTEAVPADPTGDCNDTNSNIYPGATETVADGIDQDCDGQELCYMDIDNDTFRPDATSTVISADLDCTDTTEAGAGDSTGDCNDTNAAIHPGATETVADGVDQDCNTLELCYADLDDDNYRPDATSTVISANLTCTDTTEADAGDPTGDCNDTNAAIHPGATEGVADGVDQDCNTLELCFKDQDNDGYRPDATSTVISTNLTCSDPTEAIPGDPTGDCNDNDSTVYPGAEEIVADGVDQDCNSQEICYADLDDDGFRPDAVATVISANLICTDSGEAVNADPTGDCDDNNPTIYPGATETVADNVDQDCNNQELCFADLDNDGYRPDGSSTVISTDIDCADTTEAIAADPTGDCNDNNPAIHPGATEIVADNADQDCDTLELCFADIDNDGYRPDASTTVTSFNLSCTDSGEAINSNPTGDCDDTNADSYPGATEVVADGIDQDCDGGELCYQDSDNDQYGSTNIIIDNGNLVCTDTNESTVSTDCDDENPEVNPGATEICDRKDNNCDTQIDENKVCSDPFWLLMAPAIINGGTSR